MAKKSILVVDDEHDLLDLLEYNLKKEGFKVYLADNGEKGINLAQKHQPDLVLLDVMMPKMSGFEVCEALRQDADIKRLPIIFLTAKDDEASEVEGLTIGADDYITKPISTVKLVTRIKALLRRYEETEEFEDQLRALDLVIDRDRYIVVRGAEEFQLPRKEFELLYFLMSRQGKVLDRQTLLNKVWGDNIYVVDRTVDVHVRKIREKLGEGYIETIKGVGYRFRE
ncbi:MAG: response regulator transcription factor [Bacteroidetes bacterium]|nr:response regulator transcription factor [Bacteroidota bacterium]MDA0906619.1 response regulator transcription factor [Bacteroidota bacterium]